MAIVPPLPIGSQIATGYVITHVLGRGGFGVTYRVREPGGDIVAVKEYCPFGTVRRSGPFIVPLRGREADFRASREAFKREAETLKALPRHQNIVGVRGLFEKNETIYIVMNHIDGGTLDERLKRGAPPDDDEIRHTLGHLTMALGFLHENGKLHCDVKPQNVMLRAMDKLPILIDFGAARDIGRERGGSAEMMTETYAPIELKNASYGRVGAWSDLYSLGVLGYVMATGRRPAKAEERATVLEREGADPYISCKRLKRDGVSAEIAGVIDQCLALRPMDRPRDANAMRMLLLEEPPGRPLRAETHAQTVVVVDIELPSPHRDDDRRAGEESGRIPPVVVPGPVLGLRVLILLAGLIVLSIFGYAIHALG